MATLPGLVLLLLLNRETQGRIAFSREEVIGNLYLRPLRAIQEALPRDKASILLRRQEEDASLVPLRDARTIIKDAFLELERLDQLYAGEIPLSSQLTDLQSRWSRLTETVSILDEGRVGEVYDEFDHHLAQFIALVGDESNLILDPDLQTYYLMDITLLKLPILQRALNELTEMVNEATEVEGLSAQNRSQLTVHAGLLRAQVEAIDRSMKIAFRNDPAQSLQPALQAPLDDVVTAGTRYALLIESRLLQNSMSEGGLDELRRAASQLRANGFTLWDATIVEQDRLLNDRIASFRLRRWQALLVVLVVGSLSALLVVLISQRLSDRVGRLARAATLIARDPRLEAPEREALAQLQSPDEIGTLSTSVLGMAQQLSGYIEELRQSADKLEEYNRTLEQRVAERTQEIQRKNSELEKAVELIKEAQNRLVVQEKMASLGSLTAGIAHEIKNPLNFVNNFAQLSVELIDELQEVLGPEVEKLSPDARADAEAILSDLKMNVAKINEHGGRADRIVKGMLDHSRGKSGQRQPTDLNQLVKEYTNLAYHGLRSQDPSFNITIEQHLDDSLQPIMATPQNLSRVFLNLVNNACQSAHSKKKSLGNGFVPTLTVRTQDLGDRVEVRVRDNGKGISQANLQRIFEPFFTTKPTGEGTGLGLSISYDVVVQEHGGEIRAESVEGEYAEFIVILPKVTIKA